MENEVRIVVKWSGKEYEICNLSESDSVGTLKNAIHRETGVRPERQKLLNLKLKGKTPEDGCQLSTLKLKQGFKVMMMGSLEEDIADASGPPEDIPDVVNDLDIEDEVIPSECREVYLAKIERRIKEYRINVLNEPRPGKKLLVLDVDYTLYDHRSSAETGYELMRPFLHEFLISAYQNIPACHLLWSVVTEFDQYLAIYLLNFLLAISISQAQGLGTNGSADYDIVIWSATSMKWIEEKMKLLGVSTHSDYKIAFYLDNLAMITIVTCKYGISQVKPLGVIWGKFDQYSSRNTIMFDDIRRNFLMNPGNGLKIRPFRQAHLNRDKDRELLKLAKYLKDIVHEEDFNSLDHKHWEKYRPRKKEKHTVKKESGDLGDNRDSSSAN